MLSIFRYIVSGRKLRKVSFLYIIFCRKSSSDSKNIRELAAQIIDVGKKRETNEPVVEVDADRSKAAAEQIIVGNENLLRKKKPNFSDSPKEIAEKISADIPEPPTTCCLSGCANCVWLDYADKLTKYFEHGDEEAIAKINEQVMDENLKAFILYELRMRRKK